MKEAITFEKRLQKGADKLGLLLDDHAIQRLHLYFLELKRWNRKINLIAKGSSEATIIENHFLDSLTLLPLLKGLEIHLLDVGTGAGFPGLACCAANPAITLTLVEPRLKRVSFLRHVVRTLALENVEVVASRIEDIELLPSPIRFSHITSRAVTDIPSFLDMIDRFLHADPAVICMKGAKWQEETQDLADILHSHSLELSQTKLFRLPFSGAKRALLVYHRKSG